jgi:hypothetical protein
LTTHWRIGAHILQGLLGRESLFMSSQSEEQLFLIGV